ncbi:MAG: hypothetical protein D6702_02465 [Planctomycetota bacterium]|nr:MAG: hypothetical protein D6702_02465 [Planctomycetota bacterium]
MLVPLLLSAGVAFAAPNLQVSDESGPDTCISCHQPEPGSRLHGHAPFDQGKCTSCHVQRSRLDLASNPFDATPVAPPNFMDRERSEFRPEEQFIAQRPLLLRDPAPARHRGAAVDPALLDRAEYVWVRVGRDPWQMVPLERGDRPVAEASREPRIEVERRQSALGVVAVVHLTADGPIGARVAWGGRASGTGDRYYSSELSLRLPLGHEPPETLPVEVWSHDGGRSIHEVRIADASAHLGTSGPVAPLVRANLVVASTGGDGWLEILTPDPVRLEVRAPAPAEIEAERAARERESGGGQVRFADLAEDLPAAATGTAGRPGKVPHPDLAPLEYAGTTACLSCHPGANAHGSSHPLVRPKTTGGYAWPTDLPLGRDGRMQCITCHQPHGTDEFAFHTRKDGRRDLCISCHAEVR